MTDQNEINKCVQEQIKKLEAENDAQRKSLDEIIKALYDERANHQAFEAMLVAELQQEREKRQALEKENTLLQAQFKQTVQDLADSFGDSRKDARKYQDDVGHMESELRGLQEELIKIFDAMPNFKRLNERVQNLESSTLKRRFDELLGLQCEVARSIQMLQARIQSLEEARKDSEQGLERAQKDSDQSLERARKDSDSESSCDPDLIDLLRDFPNSRKKCLDWINESNRASESAIIDTTSALVVPGVPSESPVPCETWNLPPDYVNACAFYLVTEGRIFVLYDSNNESKSRLLDVSPDTHDLNMEPLLNSGRVEILEERPLVPALENLKESLDTQEQAQCRYTMLSLLGKVPQLAGAVYLTLGDVLSWVRMMYPQIVLHILIIISRIHSCIIDTVKMHSLYTKHVTFHA